ncbi:MAG: dTDP-4-dehydrorhamnose 3,5-epimerase [Maricaulaceae bacterium]
MQFTSLKIADVIRVQTRRFGDDRGWFSETFKTSTFNEKVNKNISFVQDNHSFSAPVYTVRGLHYQSPPHAQGKLVRCPRGSILDVAVDIRRGSPTYGQWVSEVLSAENGTQLWVPEGFLHGFATLETDTEVQYKCTDYYAPECDGNIAWNDPTIGIDWGFDAGLAVLSNKDKVAPTFDTFESPFQYNKAAQ